MPTNRTRIVRPLRTPRFTAEAVDLFAQLEHQSHDSVAFKLGSKRLAAMLGLGEQYFFSGTTVNDQEKDCPWPAGYPASDDWTRCREVRTQLLQAVAQLPPLQLTDAEQSAVLQAAAPIDADKREPFIAQVAKSLYGRVQHGPGDVHRAIVSTQKQFCTYPDLSRAADRTKYSVRQSNGVTHKY
jgi:hypothetical protein